MPTLTPLRPLKEIEILTTSSFEEIDEEGDEENLIEDEPETEDADFFSDDEEGGGRKKGNDFDLNEFGEEKDSEF